MNERDVLLTVEAMRVAIARKGAHSLYVNSAGSIMYHQLESRGDKEAAKMTSYDLVGVYTNESKLSDILRDIGA